MPRGSGPTARALRPSASRSQQRAGNDLGWDLALEVLACTLAAQILPVLDGHLAAQDRHHGPGEDVVALPGRIVRLVQVLLAHLAAAAGVEDGDVGVAAGRYRAFARVETHDLGGVGRDEIDVA